MIFGKSRAAAGVFSLALFFSALIMFGVQPMMGRALLPHVGGAPAGWISAIAFFQVMLLFGYLAAHLLARLDLRRHGFFYLLALLAVIPLTSLRLTGLPDFSASGVFIGLFKSLGPAFIALSMTSSTLQRLYTGTGALDAHDPYFLYAASNAGSLAGLLLYPFVLEPFFGLAAQSSLFGGLYLLLAVLAGICLAGAWKTAAPKKKSAAEKPVSVQQQARWVLLSFVPSCLLIAVTTHITTDIFSAPLIWVLPLGAYLLTFMLAFGKKQFFLPDQIFRLQHIAAALSVALVFVYTSAVRVSTGAMIVHVIAFLLAALACHTMLAASRPAAGKLTGFYLMIALGGALGGIAGAFLAPAVFDRLIEFPLLLAAACILNPAFMKNMNVWSRITLAAGLSLTIFYIAYVTGNMGAFSPAPLTPRAASETTVADILLLSALLLFSLHARSAAAGILLVTCFVSLLVMPKTFTHMERNFFGTVRITEKPLQIGDTIYQARYMDHGTTTHGMQVISPGFETVPTTYFSKDGPAGDVMDLYNPKNIAVMGLGAGTLHCYGTPENRFTFIEIDPAVVDIAKNHFTFLTACKSAGPPRIIVGDGRVALAQLENEKFDLIVLDAFSSDTIPTHLLTVEAQQLYRERLAPGGLILMNLSNRYFQLMWPVAANAETLGLKQRFTVRSPQPRYAFPSAWMVLAPEGTSLSPLSDMGWVEMTKPKNFHPWTDDYTNLLSTMRYFIHAQTD